jgi:peptidylprolyl isomerase
MVQITFPSGIVAGMALRAQAQGVAKVGRNRRGVLAGLAGVPAIVSSPVLAEEQTAAICDSACEKALAEKAWVINDSGLQYKVIEEGSGPQARPGYQVVVDWVAFNQEGKQFENTLFDGRPKDVRITGSRESRNVIAGLDEGLSDMRVNEKRRLYIPGELAYPKGLAAAPGRPVIPPRSPLQFDVWLRYVPGLEEEQE